MAFHRLEGHRSYLLLVLFTLNIKMKTEENYSISKLASIEFLHIKSYYILGIFR